jgi:hypothetical protein
VANDRKPTLSVVTAVAPIDGRLEMAAALEATAAGLRNGSIVADYGVLVMACHAHSTLFPPKRLGRPTRATELLGLLDYAGKRVYREEIEQE